MTERSLDQRLAAPAAVLICTRPASGHGRYIKAKGDRRLFADVSLRIQPHETLALHLHHTWPTDLPVPETEALDQALLRGVMDAPPVNLSSCRPSNNALKLAAQGCLDSRSGSAAASAVLYARQSAAGI